MVAGCDDAGTSTGGPDVAVVIDAGPDATPHADNGFGNPCEPNVEDTEIWTECKSLDDLSGICVVDTCRRWCADGCIDGQIQVAGPGDLCWCEPAP